MTTGFRPAVVLIVVGALRDRGFPGHLHRGQLRPPRPPPNAVAREIEDLAAVVNTAFGSILILHRRWAAPMGCADGLRRWAAPMGRAGEPGEVAAATVWLLSDEASYVTSANLRVAAGR